MERGKRANVGMWVFIGCSYSLCVKLVSHVQCHGLIHDVLSIISNKMSTHVLSSSIERLRAERLQREAEERRRAQALLDQKNSKGKEAGREINERERPYNSAYFPELARKRQRRDQDSWRDEILKS